MGNMDLLDYIKASREDAAKEGNFVRFRIDADKNGQLFIARNKKFEEFDMGTISLSPILGGSADSKKLFDSVPHGITKMDDIKSMLTGAKVILSDGEPLDAYEPNRVNTPANRDLGGAIVEYVADDIDDAHIGGDPTKMFVPMLLTDDRLRKNGYAKFLLSQVEKYGSVNGYDAVYGVGSAIDMGFRYSNKEAKDKLFYNYYMQKYRDKNAKLIRPAANLALLYRHMGYSISPLGSYFIFSKDVKSIDASNSDMAYLHNDTTALDFDDIVLGK